MAFDYGFITEKLLVGRHIESEAFASDLSGQGVYRVINLWAGHEEMFWPAAVTTSIPQEDDGTPRDAEQVRQIVRLCLTTFALGRGVYLHCQWGIGRAPAMAYAVLRAIGLPSEEAIERIENARPQCRNWSWKRYLPSVENALRLG